jgi:uncharacterized protein (TIGR03435 family)
MPQPVSNPLPGPAVSAILLIVAAYGLLGQSAAPAFDAVSIRPNTSGLKVSGERNTPGRLIFSNTTPLRLIQRAYGVQARNVISPDSLASDRYDVTATVDAPLTRMQMLPILQGVLAERFALRSHTEMRTLPVYALRVAKGGSKLQPANDDARCAGPAARGLHEITGDFDMTRLADLLAGEADRSVVDATGLSGTYNVCLGYTPSSIAPAADTSGPDLFEALREQLGLYLASENTPVKVLIIDHIERATPN